jgi:hypothetical protein
MQKVTLRTNYTGNEVNVMSMTCVHNNSTFKCEYFERSMSKNIKESDMDHVLLY